MGMLDDLMKSVGAGAGSGGAAGGFDLQQGIALVMQLLQQVGGVEGLLAKLQAGGLGEVAQSWIGAGSNQPVSGEQLDRALGPDLMGSLGGLLGGGQQASSVLAQVLPGLIDQLTPQGRLPQAGEADPMAALGGLLGGGAQAGGLGAGLGGLLGGLMRR